jgi:hypothetical protein
VSLRTFRFGVILSPSLLVILRKRSDRRISLRINSVKQSHEIATPACRNAPLKQAGLLARAKHFGVQGRRFAPRNDNFLWAFTIVKVGILGFTK